MHLQSHPHYAAPPVEGGESGTSFLPVTSVPAAKQLPACLLMHSSGLYCSLACLSLFSPLLIQPLPPSPAASSVHLLKREQPMLW